MIMKVKSLLLFLLISITLSAAPMIEVDTAVVDRGAIEVAKVTDLTHTFIITNSGDQPLKISRIKPG